MPESLITPETNNFSIEWEISNTLSAVNETCEKLEALLTEKGWDTDDIFNTHHSFREILINAYVHGNLGIKAKSEEENFLERIQTAEKLLENQNKKIQVTLKMNGEQIEITIQDMGKDSPEFWKANTEGMRTGADTTWVSGRGIQTSEHLLDELKFEKNTIGTKVTLIKHKTRQ